MEFVSFEIIYNTLMCNDYIRQKVIYNLIYIFWCWLIRDQHLEEGLRYGWEAVQSVSVTVISDLISSEFMGNNFE